MDEDDDGNIMLWWISCKSDNFNWKTEKGDFDALRGIGVMIEMQYDDG